MVPGEHEAVAHDRRVVAQLRLAVRALAVRDVRARARAVEAPAVERALELVVAHGAAVREVGAEVRAVRVLEVELARRGRATARARGSSSAAASPRPARGRRGRRPGTSRTAWGTGSGGRPWPDFRTRFNIGETVSWQGDPEEVVAVAQPDLDPGTHRGRLVTVV